VAPVTKTRLVVSPLFIIIYPLLVVHVQRASRRHFCGSSLAEI
jgi:hypothetical protein